MLELMKTMAFGQVYDYYCHANNVPAGIGYLNEVRKYETDVLASR